MGGNGAQFLVQYKHGERSRKKARWRNERPLSASVGEWGAGNEGNTSGKTKTKSERNRDGSRRQSSGGHVTWSRGEPGLEREREERERVREEKERDFGRGSVDPPSGPGRAEKKRRETERGKSREGRTC